MNNHIKPVGLRGLLITGIVAVATIAAGCATTERMTKPDSGETQNPDRLLVVDCLLPARVQQLGQKLTYLAPRRPVKTTQSDCEIRGGEYTAYDRSNYATALKIWLPQAQQGDPAAQTYVGEIYEKGLGIMADYQVAAAWYRKAATQGYSRAMINLGYLYESGLGVEQDLVQAMNWYRKASGLAEADLEYVSTVERARRKAAVEETSSLRAEVDSLQRELEDARRQLSERKAKLETERQRAARLRARLAAEKKKLAAVPSGGDGAESARLKKALAGAQSEKAALSQALAQQKTELQRLQARLSSRELEMASAQRALDATTAKLKAAGSSSETSTAELASIRAEREAQATKVAALEAELSQLKSDYAGEKERLSTGLAQSREEQARLQQKLAGAALANSQREQEQAAQLAKMQQQNAALQQTLLANQQREAALNRQLAASGSQAKDSAALRQQLAAAQQRSQNLQQQLQTATAEQTRLQQNLMSTQLASSQSAGELSQLQKKLAASEAAISRYEKEVAALSEKAKESAAARTEVAANKVVETVADGPSIEIIDPPMAATRSVPAVFAPRGLPKIEIIGRVSAADDLLTFKVNGRKLMPNDNGLFQVEEAVGKSERKIQMLAIDRSGKRTQMQFMIVPKAENADEASPSRKGSKAVAARIDFGNYHALIIGNNEYANLTNLNTPVNDARAIEKILRTKYGYKTDLLLNANRYQILSALNKLRETLTEEDNLLIYYAGHGELDGVNQRGFWLPVDAEPDNSANWISNVAITDMLNIMNAKQVMVIADSCYSGSLTRASIARLQGGMSAKKKNKWYKLMSKARTRTVLTSGGVKPVLDSGGGKHSIFARAFIDVIGGNNQIMEGYQLYRGVLARVKQRAKRLGVEQNPQYAPLKYAGHEAGEFFFLPEAQQAAIAPAQRFRVALASRY